MNQSNNKPNFRVSNKSTLFHEIASDEIIVLNIFLLLGSCCLSFFFFSSRRRHTRWNCDWSSDVCSSDLFVVFFNAFQGVREVDRNLLNNARVLGASRRAITRHVVIPSALTWIIASLHVAFGLAIIGAIVGEFLGAQRGLGLVIATAQNNFNPDGVFAAMFIIAVLALTAEGLIGLLERRLLSWRPPSQAEAAAA